ncbi:MAG TPA: hypothetical protein VNO30_10995 [Kofleriaceae bacterium]|nr:hypothetical protein [Kofleriaceae bacterium]
MARLRKKPAAIESRAPALYIECEWLVVAIEAALVERILLASDTPVRTLPGSETTVIDTGQLWAPAWDLDAMLGSEPGRGVSWIVVRAPSSWPIAAFALRAGRCVCVRAMPRSTELPPGLAQLGAGALRSAFATSSIPELGAYSTGVVLDPLRILGQDEISRVAAELERA